MKIFLGDKKKPEDVKTFKALLQKLDNETIEVKNEQQAKDIVSELQKADHFVASIKKQTKRNNAPPRFSEASLVKTLGKMGIGRPSTYASIISTIHDRGYVKQEKRAFYATELGTLVTEKLVDHFSKIMDVKFTSHMEDELDKIEAGKTEWVDVLREFYGPFKIDLGTGNGGDEKREGDA
ncbi:MAG: DNA topoisomerase [Planctomycetota bacterium]